MLSNLVNINSMDAALTIVTTVISLSLANGISDYYWSMFSYLFHFLTPSHLIIQFSGFAFESRGHGQWLADLHHVLLSMLETWRESVSL